MLEMKLIRKRKHSPQETVCDIQTEDCGNKTKIVHGATDKLGLPLTSLVEPKWISAKELAGFSQVPPRKMQLSVKDLQEIRLGFSLSSK